MKTIEIEKKRLEKAEKKKKLYIERYKRYEDFYYLEMAKEQADIVESIKIRLNRAERAKSNLKKKRSEGFSIDRAIKSMYLETAAKYAGLEDGVICAGTSSITATAIIDEIIESEFNADQKLTMIKLFLDNNLSSLEIDGLLHEEMIIMPRKRL